MGSTLLFVTQVAPYVDGPAGVHGVLDQAAVGVAQIAELHGLTPQRVDDVRTLAAGRSASTRVRSRCSRSARRRGAVRSARPILDRVRRGDLSVARRSTPRPTRATAGTSTARSSARGSTVIRGRRRSPPTCVDVDASRVRAPRRRVAVARRGVPVPRSPPGRAGAPAACATASSISPPPARGRRRSATRSRGASREGAGAVFSTEPRSLPARVGVARVPPPPRRWARLGARPDLVTRRRNFSDWAYWRLQLDTVARRRSLPRRSRRASSRGGRAPTRACRTLLGPAPDRRSARRRDDRLGRLRHVPPRPHRLRHRTHDVGARVPARAARSATRPDPPCSRSTGTAPGKDLVCGVVPGGAGDDYADQLARAGYVVLAPGPPRLR